MEPLQPLQPTPPPTGRKLHPSLDDPVDNVMVALADAAMPFFRATGHTPNMLTAYSGVFAALAVWQAYHGNMPAFAIAWMVAYWFDCADGHFARTYNMQTEFGDWLDHTKDNVSMYALAGVVLYKYRPPWWLAVAVIAVWMLSFVHLGCQQKHYAQRLGTNSGESIDTLQKLCPLDDAETALRATRYVGIGTAQVLTVAAVWFAVARQ